jgi:hypothetical protein
MHLQVEKDQLLLYGGVCDYENRFVDDWTRYMMNKATLSKETM